MEGSNYISIGYNFLQLVVNSVEEMEKQENRSSTIVSGDLPDDEAWAIHHERTKWNDQNIAIPILFNFFHGYELILKGLIVHCGGKLNRTHKLTKLLEDLKKSPENPDNKLITHLQIVIYENGFEHFFIENNSSVDHFYDLLKYPENSLGVETKFWNIKRQEKLGLKKFIKLSELASLAKIEIHNWKNK